MAVQYAIMAMGDSFRGLLPESQTYVSWEAFVQSLKLKLLLHTAEWSLFLEVKQWHAERDWPSFHAKIQTYRMFLYKALEPAIMVFMIAALPDYLARKVTKLPLPENLDDAVARTWQAFRTCPPPMQAQAYAPPATSAGIVTPSNPQMDLDALMALPSSSFSSTPRFPQDTMLNVFSGKPMAQTFGRSRSPARASHTGAHLNAVPGYPSGQPRQSPRPRPERSPDDKQAERPDTRAADRPKRYSDDKRAERPETRAVDRPNRYSDDRRTGRPQWRQRRDGDGRPSSQQSRGSQSSQRSSQRYSDRSSSRSREDRDRRFPARKPSRDDRARPEQSSADKEKGKARASKTQGCFICGEDSHWARECPHREELLRVRKDQPERKTRTPSHSTRAGKESGR